LEKGAKDREVFQIFVEVFGFWRFEAAGMEFEARIVDDVTKGFFADFALADASVAIDAGAEIGFGIVEVKSENLGETDELFDLADGVVPAFLGAEIETGFEEVGGVEADAEAARIFNALKNFAEMFDAVPEAASLAGGVFESDADGRHFCDGENFVEAGNDILDAGFFTRAEMRAGMHDQKRKAESGGEIDFLDERFYRIIAIGRRRGAEVNEVAGMAEDGLEFSGGELVCVEREFLRFMWAGEPLHVVFDKELNDLATDLDAAFEGFVWSAGGGHVGAEFHFVK
jgi:hypothetical protein